MIVNAGFQKTGTVTCGKALELLGYRYHKASATSRNNHIKGRHILNVLDGFNACGDFPFPFMLDEIGPQKVILTVRKSPKIWLESLKKHLNRQTTEASKHYYFNGNKLKSGSELKRFYESHNDWVRMWCSKNDVPILEVCWERGDGWNELCGFLGKPIPDKEFPWLNKS